MIGPKFSFTLSSKELQRVVMTENGELKCSGFVYDSKDHVIVLSYINIGIGI